MESKELIAAARNIKALQFYEGQRSAHKIADYILANVREDDDSPATIEEVREAINKVERDVEWCSVYMANNVICVGLECGVKISTRGQLRRLLEVLGGGA